MEWISAKEKQPLSNDDVLVYSIDDCCLASWTSEFGWICRCESNYHENPDYWMPLPPEPKDKP